MPPKKEGSWRTNAKYCQRCRLRLDRTQVVAYRGEIPADITFVGEAPGANEDLFGEPFVGPAGFELNRWIELVRRDLGPLRILITNTVWCIPKDNQGIRQPTEGEVQACSFNLKQILEAAKSTLVVALGNVASDAITKMGIEHLHVLHPAAVIRMEERVEPRLRQVAKIVTAYEKRKEGP